MGQAEKTKNRFCVETVFLIEFCTSFWDEKKKKDLNALIFIHILPVFNGVNVFALLGC
jgi:hypothetical protein